MKKTLIAFAALCAAFVATAEGDSLLYWMVNDPYDMARGNSTTHPIAFDYAMISIDGGASYLKIYNTSGDLLGDELGVNYGSTSVAGPVYAGYFDASSSPSFLLQLFDDDENLVGWRTYAYSEVAGSVMNAYSGGGGSPFKVEGVIPEPSCGLLTLVGLAVMALRRRRAAC